jgi:glycosyltransferase involved in cell wall biosynthesis
VLCKSATKLLSNSELAFDNFHPGWQKKEKSRYKVIKNGVPYYSDTEDDQNQIDKIKNELGLSLNNFVIGNVSSFRKQKNHSTIIKVAKNLIQEFPNIKFLMIGNLVRQGLYKQLEEEDIQDFFIMPGIRNDIPQLLKLMDTFIFPSTIEGQPNALIEAMLYEVPVFASNISTIQDSTPFEVHTNLFSPYDYQSFSDAIKTYLKTGKTYDVKKVADWAKKEFDPETRFNEFLVELNN